jgi:hypothetical protein
MKSMSTVSIRRQPRGTSVGGRFSASANPDTAVKLRPDFNAIVDVSVARIETARRDLHLIEDDIGLSAARALAAIALRRFPTAATVHVSGGEQPMGTAVPAAILDAGGRVLWEPEEADEVWGELREFTEASRFAKDRFEHYGGREQGWFVPVELAR